MKYPEAAKKAKAEKPTENRMVIKIDARLVLPYKDGLLLMHTVRVV